MKLDHWFQCVKYLWRWLLMMTVKMNGHEKRITWTFFLKDRSYYKNTKQALGEQAWRKDIIKSKKWAQKRSFRNRGRKTLKVTSIAAPCHKKVHTNPQSQLPRTNNQKRNNNSKGLFYQWSKTNASWHKKMAVKAPRTTSLLQLHKEGNIHDTTMMIKSKYK